MKKAPIIVIVVILALIVIAGPVSAACVWVCNEDTTTITVQKDKDGRRSVWTEVIRDAEGALISRRLDTYTYYPNGDVKDINQAVYNAADKKIGEKTVTHYPDKQPTVSVVMVEQ